MATRKIPAFFKRYLLSLSHEERMMIYDWWVHAESDDELAIILGGK